MIAADTAPTTRSIQSQAIEALQNAMQDGERFDKIHAAEALIELGLPEGVHAAFLAEDRAHHDEPSYRLGIWRVLARTSSDAAESDRWIENVRKVAFDPAASDRIGAVESLAKLKYMPKSDERPAIEKLAAGNNDGIALFATWLLYQTPGSANPQDRVAKYLDSTDPITRLRAIYILRFLPNLTPANRSRLKAAARKEPKDSLTYAYSTGSSFIVAKIYCDDDEADRTHAELYRILESGSDAQKQEACAALGAEGNKDDLAALLPLLNSAAAPARVGAGFAIVRIARRTAPPQTTRQSRRPEPRPARRVVIG